MKKKPPTIEQMMATGAVVHDAYSELLPVVKELMLGRELGKEEGAAVLGMIITTFYHGKDLQAFVAMLGVLAVHSESWRKP